MDTVHHYLVPEQYKGIKKDISYAAELADTEDADLWFIDLKNKLLDVSHWKAGDDVDVMFALTDKQKKLLHRPAHSQDLVQIYPNRYRVGDIWSYAQVHTIEYDYDPDADDESIGLLLCLPCAENDGMTYSPDDTTITIVCERKGAEICLHWHLRNFAGPESADIGAWANVTDEQWLALLKSFAQQ